MLSVVKSVAGDTVHLPLPAGACSLTRRPTAPWETIQLLQLKTSKFIAPDVCRQTALYKPCSRLQYLGHHVAACILYEIRVNNVYELKQRVSEVWSGVDWSKTLLTLSYCWRLQQVTVSLCSHTHMGVITAVFLPDIQPGEGEFPPPGNYKFPRKFLLV